MKRALISFVLLCAAFAQAFAQTTGVPYFPQTLPGSTVVGRLSANPGATEAIPFSKLGQILAGYSVLACNNSGLINVNSCVQTALNTASISKKVLFVPAGTYLVTGLLIHSGTHVLGEGMGATIFKQDTNARQNFISLFPGSNVTLQDFTMDGNGSHQDTDLYALAASQAVGLRVHRIEIKNPRSTMLWINTDGTDGHGAGGLPAGPDGEQHSYNVRITDSIFNASNVITDNGDMIVLGAIDDWIFSGNKISGGGGNQVAIQSARNFTYSNNRHTLFWGAVYVETSQFGSIINNHMETLGTETAIVGDGTAFGVWATTMDESPSPGAPSYNGPRNLIIAGNTITGLTRISGATGIKGIRVSGPSGYPAQDVSVFNNKLSGFVLTSPATGSRYGVVVEGDTDRISVHGNSIEGMDAAVVLGQTYRSGSTPTYTSLIGNAYSSSINGIAFLGTSETQTGLVQAGNTGPTVYNTLVGPINTTTTSSASTPDYSFTGDPDTGMFRVAANKLGFATGGTQQLSISSAGQLAVTALGNNTAPTYSFAGDENTGMYSPGADQLAFAIGGGQQLLMVSSQLRSTNDGLVGTPAWSFVNDTGMGLYRVSSNVMGVSINGAQVSRYDTNGLLNMGGTAIPAGGTAGLGYRFSSTSNFGFFFGSGAPSLAAARGSLYLRSDGTFPYVNTDGSTTWDAVVALSATQTLASKTIATGTFTGVSTFPNGSAAAPSITGATATTGAFFGTHLAGLASSGIAAFQASDTSSITVPTTRLYTTGTHLLSSGSGVSTLVNVVGGGSAGSGSASLLFYSFGTGANVPAFYSFPSGGTSNSPTALASGATMFTVGVSGNDATTYGGSVNVADADMTFLATENFAVGAHGTKIAFRTTPTGGVAIATAFSIHASGGISVGNITNDPGAGMIYTNAATFMTRTKTSWSTGAAASAGTLTNAPSAGNPTKWIPVDDNGTTRYIPAW